MDSPNLNLNWALAQTPLFPHLTGHRPRLCRSWIYGAKTLASLLLPVRRSRARGGRSSRSFSAAAPGTHVEPGKRSQLQPPLAVADEEALHRRRRGEGARRRQETASSLRLRKWGGAMVWCPRIDGSAIQLSPAHRSAEAVGWDLAQFNVGCLTQRRCSFRSKEQEQNKSWMLKTWQ